MLKFDQIKIFPLAPQTATSTIEILRVQAYTCLRSGDPFGIL